jgi:hypothetical protein
LKSTIKKKATKEDRDLIALYTERYKRIKDERKLFLNTIIGLSGGTIVLSVTLLEKIAPKRLHLWLVIAAWVSLGLAILVGVFFLVEMIRRSLRMQKLLERELQGGIPAPCYFPIRASYQRSSLSESITGFFFVLGILLLGAFAITNLIFK